MHTDLVHSTLDTERASELVSQSDKTTCNLLINSDQHLATVMAVQLFRDTMPIRLKLGTTAADLHTVFISITTSSVLIVERYSVLNRNEMKLFERR